jgi:hypothetical protein
MKNGFYSDPDFQTVREYAGVVAGGAATTAYAKFRSFAATKLLRVNAHVTTAGTHAAHGFDVYVGTSSVGTILLGTSTAGVDAEVTLNTDVPAKGDIFVKSLADIVGKADITFEYVERYVS